MPFGAECLDKEGVRFRLWAPAARRVEVGLENAKRPLLIALERRDNVWFELVADDASPGTQFRFRSDEKQEVPDPAAPCQPADGHGPSEVIDPAPFDWQDRLHWSVMAEPQHREWLSPYRDLLQLTSAHITPRLSEACCFHADYEVYGDRGIVARWRVQDNSELTLLAGLGAAPLSGRARPVGQTVYASTGVDTENLEWRTMLPARSVARVVTS